MVMNSLTSLSPDIGCRSGAKFCAVHRFREIRYSSKTSRIWAAVVLTPMLPPNSTNGRQMLDPKPHSHIDAVDLTDNVPVPSSVEYILK